MGPITLLVASTGQPGRSFVFRVGSEKQAPPGCFPVIRDDILSIHIGLISIRHCKDPIIKQPGFHFNHNKVVVFGAAEVNKYYRQMFLPQQKA